MEQTEQHKPEGKRLLPETRTATAPIAEEVVVMISKERFSSLVNLKEKIGLKLYHELEEKLSFEQEQLHAYSARSVKATAMRQRYSLILDEHYFEQKLLSQIS